MRYYLLRPDHSVPHKWVLGDIRHVNNWHFSNPPPNYMEPGTYTLDVRFEGVEVDYALAGYGSVPVLSRRARDALVGLPEVDKPYHHLVLEPVHIANTHVEQDYFVMIIETQVECVDQQHSEYQRYAVDDPVRPDRAGDYRGFTRLVIDPVNVGGRDIFRLKHYLGAIIVSEEVKRRFESAGVVGMAFDSVNGDTTTVT
ncbi:imm11 family protein [Pseudomonas cerasi]